MGKESTRCKVRDDSACEQNGESRRFRVNLRQPQGQLCRLSLLLLLPVVMAGIPTSLAPSCSSSWGATVSTARVVGLCLVLGTLQSWQLLGRCWWDSACSP